MLKESTRTIYQCLTPTFWTQRKCHACQIFFTPTDYQKHNYQLSFAKLLKVQANCLAVTVQLTHLTCDLNYQQEIITH